MAKQKELKGMNKYQKKAHRRGEDRLRGNQVEYYLSLAYSSNPDDRVEAMDNLCPVTFGKALTKCGWHCTKGWSIPTCASEKPRGIHWMMAGIRTIQDCNRSLKESPKRKPIRGFAKMHLTSSLLPETLRIRRKCCWDRKHTPFLDDAIGVARQTYRSVMITRPSLRQAAPNVSL